MDTADGVHVPDLEQRVHLAVMNTLEQGKDLFDVFLDLDVIEAAYFVAYVLPILEVLN